MISLLFLKSILKLYLMRKQKSLKFQLRGMKFFNIYNAKVNILHHISNIYFLTFSFQSKVPPLTPSTNKKVGDALKSTYNTWNKETERSAVPKDPRSWTKEHVRHWLTWAIREFSLDGPNFSQFVQQFQVRPFSSIYFIIPYFQVKRNI